MIKATIKNYEAKLTGKNTDGGEMLILIDFLIGNIEKHCNIDFKEVIKLIKETRKQTETKDDTINNTN